MIHVKQPLHTDYYHRLLHIIVLITKTPASLFQHEISKQSNSEHLLKRCDCPTIKALPFVPFEEIFFFINQFRHSLKKQKQNNIYKKI